MSKVFERILHSKLKALSESASGLWFNDSQHDFLVGWSIESARSTLESIIEDNKKKLFDFCAFLDIKGAFDAAWQPAILHGLQCKGCPLYLVKILISFLNSPPRQSFPTTVLLLEPKKILTAHKAAYFLLFFGTSDSLLDASFQFPNKIIAYVDDLVICT